LKRAAHNSTPGARGEVIQLLASLIQSRQNQFGVFKQYSTRLGEGCRLGATWAIEKLVTNRPFQGSGLLAHG
jgi:hypothetical protein